MNLKTNLGFSFTFKHLAFLKSQSRDESGNGILRMQQQMSEIDRLGFELSLLNESDPSETLFHMKETIPLLQQHKHLIMW